MSEQMYSADEAAQLLGLQVRTVRNYVREGLLPGVRIGKQYRIARPDLEAFTAGRALGGEPGVDHPRTRDPGTGQALPPSSASSEVSSVVQVERITPEEVERIERTLAALRGAGSGQPGPAVRIEPLYDEQRGRLKLVVVGSLAETCEILRIVDALTRER